MVGVEETEGTDGITGTEGTVGAIGFVLPCWHFPLTRVNPSLLERTLQVILPSLYLEHYIKARISYTKRKKFMK
jgi:hypothetical protein